MFHKKINPTEILKQYISSYHIIESNSSIDFLPKHRVYTYGAVVLVFHYGQPSLFQKRNESPEIESRTVICGQQTSFYDLALSGKTGMIFVIFRPYGAGMFFNMPMNEIANQNIAFEHLVNNEAPEIEDKIINANSIQERVNIIEDFLIKKLIQNNKDVMRILMAFDNINHSKGQISIKQLAEISCLSIKQFERKFSELVGLNPKQYLRIVRFQNIQRIRNSRHFDNYTGLAYDCGYFDQSHFIHEFKMITDLSPKEFFNTQIINS